MKRTVNNVSLLKTIAVMVLCLAVWIPIPANAGEITIAAASDLTFAFKDVASRFEKQTGTSVKLSYGSSGNFFSQIQNGAPYDLFFSADIDYTKKLKADSFPRPDTTLPHPTEII